uniref:UBA domain-containing protein n=1 Tax=Serinus canaria TaxID=9135 RepID=A0A8C9MFE1_SERCA
MFVFQATAEQIRLAQMIYDKNDTDFEDKVKQLMEVTGKNQDECIVALHDCNGDMNRAINILLEGNSDTTSWETVGGKKKNLGKEGFENKENREKRGDREMSRGWGSSNRWGRGGSRGREFRAEENGMDNSQGDRPSDRGKRSRGRGLNPLIHDINKNIKQNWPQHRPLRDTTSDWLPAGCSTVHQHSGPGHPASS